jgi:hypothetical protein
MACSSIRHAGGQTVPGTPRRCAATASGAIGAGGVAIRAPETSPFYRELPFSQTAVAMPGGRVPPSRPG